MTRDLYSLNLLAKLMVLHRQILFSLAIAAIAEAILMRTSALHRVAPRHLKQVTSSNVWPFTLMSAMMLFRAVGHDLAFFFSVLTSIPYTVDLSTSLLARS